MLAEFSFHDLPATLSIASCAESNRDCNKDLASISRFSTIKTTLIGKRLLSPRRLGINRLLQRHQKSQTRKKRQLSPRSALDLPSPLLTNGLHCNHHAFACIDAEDATVINRLSPFYNNRPPSRCTVQMLPEHSGKGGELAEYISVTRTW